MNVPHQAQGWAASEKGASLRPYSFALPERGDFDVALEVLSCGVCHSDLHLLDNDWGNSVYPLVPGHEIIGRVVDRGKNAAVALGAIVGVGWQRAACLHCPDCLSARENMCDTQEATCVGHQGGYADYHVTDSRFCFPMPEGTEAPGFAPLLCAGATVYSPLCEFLDDTARPSAHVGVVALGGLGHLAVKFANAMGYEVTLFSSSPSKEAEARSMGAHHFVSSASPAQIEKIGRQLDLILVTANVDLPWASYLRTLRSDGTLCFVGIPPSPFPVSVFEILSKRLRVAASPIGSRARISQMLEFAALHRIQAEVEVFPMEKVNDALVKVRGNKVRYRAVLARG